MQPARAYISAPQLAAGAFEWPTIRLVHYGYAPRT